MTNTNRKPTKRTRYSELLAIPEVASNPDLVSFISHEVELLDRKNATTAGGDRKPTKDQIANEGYKAEILEIIGTKSLTVSDIRKMWTNAAVDMTSQKCTSLVTQMARAGILDRTEVKGKAYFSVANPTDEGED